MSIFKIAVLGLAAGAGATAGMYNYGTKFVTVPLYGAGASMCTWLSYIGMSHLLERNIDHGNIRHLIDLGVVLVGSFGAFEFGWDFLSEIGALEDSAPYVTNEDISIIGSTSPAVVE